MTDRKAALDPERLRLEEDVRRAKNWKRWGPYLSERQWGTVREDYSPDGTAWDYFPHDHARSRAYRWGEDGLLGICDRHQYVCFALALWNGKDPILKERLFGLTGPQGNHGEDVKECYYYLDSTPTHSYMKGLYKYPQREFPYARLVDENRRRTRQRSGVRARSTRASSTTTATSTSSSSTPRRARRHPRSASRVANRGPEAATAAPSADVLVSQHLVLGPRRPPAAAARRRVPRRVRRTIDVDSEYYGRLRSACEGAPELLFTENETNAQRLWGAENESALRQGRHPRLRRPRRRGRRQSRRASARRRRPTTS